MNDECRKCLKMARLIDKLINERARHKQAVDSHDEQKLLIDVLRKKLSRSEREKGELQERIEADDQDSMDEIHRLQYQVDELEQSAGQMIRSLCSRFNVRYQADTAISTELLLSDLESVIEQAYRDGVEDGRRQKERADRQGACEVAFSESSEARC